MLCARCVRAVCLCEQAISSHRLMLCVRVCAAGSCWTAHLVSQCCAVSSCDWQQVGGSTAPLCPVSHCPTTPQSLSVSHCITDSCCACVPHVCAQSAAALPAGPAAFRCSEPAIGSRFLDLWPRSAPFLTAQLPLNLSQSLTV